MSKPSILLVPGSFTPAHVYDNVVEKVAAKGYDIRALQIPSVRLETESPTSREPPSMYKDAAFIASQAAALADDGREVIIISHSYGGTPATESVRELPKDDRQKLGKQGGVVRLAYMTALVPALGSSAGNVLEMGERPEEDRITMEADAVGWLTIPVTAKTVRLLVPGLPQADGEAWAGKMTAHSAASFGDALTYAGYKDVPVSYLICEEDPVIPAGSQSRMIGLVEQESGRKVDVTRLPAGHAPNITATQAVVDWIIHVANLDGNSGA